MNDLIAELRKILDLAENSTDPVDHHQYADRIQWLARKFIHSGGGTPSPDSPPIPPCPGCHP